MKVISTGSRFYLQECIGTKHLDMRKWVPRYPSEMVEESTNVRVACRATIREAWGVGNGATRKTIKQGRWVGCLEDER